MPPTTDHARPPRLVALGELLLDVSPGTPGASLDGDGLLLPAAGGAPANVAVAAARLGADSAFIGAVGDDPFGRRLRRTLAAAGVDVSGVVSVAAPTAVAFVALTHDGEREFMFYGRPAAHDMLSAADVDAWFAPRPLSAGDVLHLSSNCLAREPARQASRRAIDLASAAGAAVSFDVNLRPSLWDARDPAALLDVVRPVLHLARLVKLSLTELEFITGGRTPVLARELASRLLAGDAVLVCVTLGGAGAWYFARGGSGHVPGYPVAAVDTTGAGDAFAAAIAVTTLADPDTWSDGPASDAAVRRACAYAALSTTRQGAIPSYGDERELHAFLADTAHHGR